MQRMDCELVVLGGGPAGYVAAIRAAQLGAKVVLVEQNSLGGACMNVGCIPTKALLKSAEALHSLKTAKDFGCTPTEATVDWSLAVARKNKIVSQLGLGVEALMKEHGVTVLRGTGHHEAEGQLRVEMTEGTCLLHYEKLILATGSRPKKAENLPGATLPGVMDSSEALALETVPEKLVVIGGGVIGLEFATMFRHAGAEVTVLELSDQILVGEDVDIATELTKILKRERIALQTGARVSKITEEADGLRVHYLHKDKEKTVDCTRVLLALGRSLNTEVAEAMGLRMQAGAIVVDAHMQTAKSNIYAAGDVVGGLLLAHLAFAEGRVAAECAMGQHARMDYHCVPACVYTTPEFAAVGMSEREAAAAGISVRVGRFDFRHNGRALTLGSRVGYVKVICAEDGTILGGRILGEGASEMISELSLATQLKLKAETIAALVHPHPSMSEGIWEACCSIAGKPMHSV